MARLSSEQPDPFQYDTLRNMVICTTCKKGVSAERTALDNHLNTYHKEQYGTRARQEIRDRYLGQGYLVKNDHEGEARAKKCGWHAYLPCENGFCCPRDQCSAAQTEKWVTKMMLTRHPWDKLDPIPCMVSWLWGETKGLFVVEKPTPDQSPDERARLLREQPLEAAITQLDETLHRRKVEQSVVRLSVTTREPLWYERTGWPTTYNGLNMSTLHGLVSLKPEPGDIFKVDTVRGLVRKLLDTCHLTLNMTYEHGGDGALLRRILFAVEDDSKRRAMERHRSSEQYILVWEKFMLFLLRVAEWPLSQQQANRIELDTLVLSAVRNLRDNSNVVAEEESRRIDHEDHTTLCCDQILLISTLIIEQLRGYGRSTSPLLYFLGVEGFNLKTNQWASPSRHSSTLSHVIYCIRIVVLEYIFRQPQPAETMTERLDEYCMEHIHSAQPKVFDEVFSQRNYAQEIAKDFYGRPTIYWEADRTTLCYENHKFQINQIRYWIKCLIDEAEEVTCQELLGTDKSYLAIFNPTGLQDNLTWETCGASLIDQNQKILGSRRDHAVSRAKEDPNLHWYQVWTKGVAVRDAIRVRYLESIRRWQQKMGPLLIATGGGGPRATEVGSAVWCNTQTSMRSYYVALGHFLWVADYNKTERRTGAPRVVARFYPRRIGQLMIAFMAEVQPFYQLLCTLSELQDATIFSELFWHTDGNPWTAEQFTPAMSQTTKQHLKVALGIRAWRQIHIALQQEVVRSEDGDQDDDEDNMALQNGHSREVEAAHYALNVDMLRGLNEKVMTAFLESSRKWHSFLDLDDIPVTSVPRKRALPSDGAQQSTYGLEQSINELRNTVIDLQRLVTCPASPAQPSKRARYTVEESTNQYSQTEMWGALRKQLSLWYKDFQWRSVGQLEAVDKMVYSPRAKDIFVQLPTGAGKTMVVEVAAFLEEGKTTIVVVPYRSIRDALVNSLREKGIEVNDYHSEAGRAVNVVIIVLETWSVDRSFRTFVDELVSNGRLSRIIYDEAHLAVMESTDNFRPWHEVLQARPADVQRIFMSATMPLDVRNVLIEMASLDKEHLVHVRQSSNIPGIKWQVVEYEMETLLPTITTLVKGSGKTLVYVMSKATGRLIAKETDWPFYCGDLTDQEGVKMLKAFQDGKESVMLATTAIGPGINVTVNHIIALGGGWDGITVAQQGGRLVRKPGQRGVCTLLVTARDKRLIALAAASSQPGPGKVMLNDIVHTDICRRASLVSYLDDTAYPACRPGDELCDLCDARELAARSPPGVIKLLSVGQVWARQTGTSQDLKSDSTIPLSQLDDAGASEQSMSKSGHDASLSGLTSHLSSDGSKSSGKTTSATSPPQSLRQGQSESKSWVMGAPTADHLGKTAAVRLLDALYTNHARGYYCVRCWVHGDIENHSGNYKACPGWSLGEHVPGCAEDRTSSERVAERVDEIRRRWKKAGGGRQDKLRLHANCAFALRPNPFHPDGDWMFSMQCPVSGDLWAIVEAALEDVELTKYLSMTWQLERAQWREQAEVGYGSVTPLGRRLMAPVAMQSHTVVLHQVAIGILQVKGLLENE